MKNSTVLSIQPLGFPWQTKDPFLFCAYHADAYPAGKEDMSPNAALSGRNLGRDFTIKDGWRMYHGTTVPGFPSHPHRGFETVTIAKEGLVDHADSLGAAGRFGNGDVQWMTAGRGVQHSEMFPLLNSEGENPLELFQIWLNLPREKKMADPHFAMLWADTIPKLKTKDTKDRSIEVDVITGQLGELEAPKPPKDSWACDPEHEVNIWLIRLAPKAEWTIPPAKQNLNRSLYFYKGKSIRISEETVEVQHAIEIQSDQETSLKNGAEETHLLLLQGKPIKEQVAQYGPFVMNSQLEIREAMQDFQRTQFGGWPWPRTDQVHDREKGRFAKYADGTIEEK